MLSVSEGKTVMISTATDTNRLRMCLVKLGFDLDVRISAQGFKPET